MVTEDWKIANVTAFFKTGDPGNYKPFSVMSVLDKVVESLIIVNILKHIEEQGFLRKVSMAPVRISLVSQTF